MESVRRLRDAYRRRELELARAEREERRRVRQARRRAGVRRPRPEDLADVRGWRGVAARLSLVLVRLLVPRPLAYYTLGASGKRSFDRLAVIGFFVIAVVLVATGGAGVAAGVVVVGAGGTIAARRVERWATRIRSGSAA
jgi:hypothetical protein